MSPNLFAGSPLLVALVCGTLACTAPDSDSQSASEAEFALQLLVSAIATADTAVVYDLFWPEATYDDYANQHSYQGIQEIVGYVMGPHAWGDDVYMNVGRVHRTESGAIGEWVFSAMQARPLGEHYPTGTGREVVLNGITVVELDDGRIIRAADYTDAASMMLQLGARIEMPGGQIVEMDGGR